jgi:hypothetical protein
MATAVAWPFALVPAAAVAVPRPSGRLAASLMMPMVAGWRRRAIGRLEWQRRRLCGRPEFRRDEGSRRRRMMRWLPVVMMVVATTVPVATVVPGAASVQQQHAGDTQEEIPCCASGLTRSRPIATASLPPHPVPWRDSVRGALFIPPKVTHRRRARLTCAPRSVRSGACPGTRHGDSQGLRSIAR